MTGPQRFRKKPVPVEAMQWVHDAPQSASPVLGWIREHGGEATFTPLMEPAIVITTLEGEMRARSGDWIIRGVRGEFYPCKPDIFEATYNPDQSPLSHELRTIADAVLSSPHPTSLGTIRRIPYVGEYAEAVQITVEAMFTAEEIERLRGEL